MLQKQRLSDDQSQQRAERNSQFIIRNIISDLTILLLLYFGLIENLNKTAKEAVLVEIIEMMLEREGASDVNSAY